MSTQPDPEYVAALTAAKDCLHVVTVRLEATLERRDELEQREKRED
jgi:hypothetical protein